MAEKLSKNGFTKEQYLNSDKYADKRDLIVALLKDDETYTTSQVDKLINDFLKKEVK